MQETQETQVRPLGQEDPLEKAVATHSSVLAGEELSLLSTQRLALGECSFTRRWAGLGLTAATTLPGCTHSECSHSVVDSWATVAQGPWLPNASPSLGPRVNRSTHFPLLRVYSTPRLTPSEDSSESHLCPLSTPLWDSLPSSALLVTADQPQPLAYFQPQFCHRPWFCSNSSTSPNHSPLWDQRNFSKCLVRSQQYLICSFQTAMG